MEWYVWYYNCNSKKIETYNVLRNHEATIKLMKKKSKSIQEFAKELRGEMMYYFWSKFEWETTLMSYGEMTDGKEAIRIDVWEQINLNFDRFVEYCWNEC